MVLNSERKENQIIISDDGHCQIISQNKCIWVCDCNNGGHSSKEEDRKKIVMMMGFGCCVRCEAAVGISFSRIWTRSLEVRALRIFSQSGTALRTSQISRGHTTKTDLKCKVSQAENILTLWESVTLAMFINTTMESDTQRCRYWHNHVTPDWTHPACWEVKTLQAGMHPLRALLLLNRVRFLFLTPAKIEKASSVEWWHRKNTFGIF